MSNKSLSKSTLSCLQRRWKSCFISREYVSLWNRRRSMKTSFNKWKVRSNWMRIKMAIWLSNRRVSYPYTTLMSSTEMTTVNHTRNRSKLLMWQTGRLIGTKYRAGVKFRKSSERYTRQWASRETASETNSSKWSNSSRILKSLASQSSTKRSTR